MRIKLNEVTPRRIYDAVARRVADAPDALAWHWAGLSEINRARLEKYRNIHQGERCVIMANGPSLGRMELGKLAGEHTMSMNRAYLLYKQWGFLPSYYVCINELVLEQFANDIAQLKMPKFLNHNRRNLFESSVADESMMFMRFGFGLVDSFGGDVTESLSSGGTVTYASLQLAYFMGFNEVVLVGLDHDFVEKGVPNTTEVRKSDKDESHCHPDYFPKGIKWQLPDLYRSELAYAMAREAFEKNGRRILDATVGGKCTIFEKADFDTLF